MKPMKVLWHIVAIANFLAIAYTILFGLEFIGD